MGRTYTPSEALKVHERIARASGFALADQWLQAKGFVSVSEARLAARGGVTEANLNLAVTRAVASAAAARDAKKARKAARGARESEDALIRRKITEALAARGITETLTGASAPQEPRGTARPLEEYSDAELHNAWLASNAAVTDSPTWRGLAAGLDVPILPAGQGDSSPAPDAPLDALSAEQFRDRARQGFAAHSKAAGFGSPVWQD